MQGTPSLLQHLRPAAYPKLKRLCSGGEACPTSLATTWHPYVKFYNKYGPTEATVNASFHPYDPQRNYGAMLPIGSPIGNAQLVILDENRRLSPQGALGELYIGGVGVSRGYLKRPSLTEERFIEWPTGSGRWFYRGYRIELGEIENSIEGDAGVDKGVVVAHKSEAGHTRLIAYVLPNDNFSLSALWDRIHSELPEYMAPSSIVELDSLPMTPNGKIDKRGLPKPGKIQDSATDFQAPKSSVEKELASIWQELLGLEQTSGKSR